MTWIPSANPVPFDLKRIWNYDSNPTLPLLADGPVAGVASFRGVAGVNYGVAYLPQDSAYGIAAEAAVYRGDWTWEGFVYFNAFPIGSQHYLFTSGGWQALAGEQNNITCGIRTSPGGFLGEKRLQFFWQTTGGATVTSAANSITQLSAGVWYHLALVKDATAKQVTYYLNGVADGVSAFSANPVGGDSTVPFALRTAWAGYIGGYGLGTNLRMGASEFSTVMRDAAWLSANAARVSTDGKLNTDANTWSYVPAIQRTLSEQYVSAVPAGGATSGNVGPLYRNRAYDTTLAQTVYWTSASPGGGYPGPGPLTKIVVVEVCV